MFYIHPVKNYALVALLLMAIGGNAQDPGWQQKADITIQVLLNDTDRTLDGFETLTYFNNSPDTLHFIWFHIWPNAYKNDRTAFSNQVLSLGNTAFYFSSKDQRGYINRLDFKVNGTTAKTEDHPEHIDVIKLLLPAPLPPASQCTITTPFHVKLPYIFSRSGYANGAFQVTQWYPKPAVYDAQGWHPMPYLQQGEFYSEFGDYDISITLQQAYVVAATGVLQNTSEQLGQNKLLAPATEAKKITTAASAKKRHGHFKKLPAKPSKGKRVDTTPALHAATKTLLFTQKNVHDFAWIANKTFQVDTDTCLLPSGKIITVQTFYKNIPNTLWKKSLGFAKAALRFYANEVGDYPYSTMRIAESSVASGGGMEYPTLAVVSPALTEKMLDLVIAHEVGHNWFYGALATNERDAPWLDEGINTFYQQKYMAQKYDTAGGLETILLQTLAKQKRDQPIATAAQHFSALNYNVVAYYKTAQWLQLIEQKWGIASFRRAMQRYFQQWQFRHPQEKDFQKAIYTEMQDTAAFALLHQTGLLPNGPRSTFKIVSPFAPKTVKNFIRQPAKNRLALFPAAGYNQYDKLMLGGLITNYGLPPSALQFIAVPLYATGSKIATGIASIRYTMYPARRFAKIAGALSGMGFSKRYMPDSNGTAQYERFFKIAPSLRVQFRQPVQSTKETGFEAKSFFIFERSFTNFITKASDGLTYVDSLKTNSYYINQLSFHVADYRALYPYQYGLQLQQGQSFYRINASGNYFFNYAKGGGAMVRLFAAKFGYLNTNTAQRYSTTRFQPKLLGTTGDEDYTYSSYFLGRTASYANDDAVVKNSGLAAQQIALRDGAFKLRLDAFDFLQGRYDDWVAAINVTTTLPRRLIPALLPLKFFLDAGTFAEAKETASIHTRVLFVGGLQLSLLKNVLNIYAPVVYSKVFRDNLKSVPEQNTFFKRLTFSIDLSQLSVQRFTNNKFSL